MNKLKKELELKNEQIKSLVKKMELYKIGYDKYQVISEVVNGQNEVTCEEQTVLTDSTHLVCIDLGNPSVMINKAQKNLLSSEKHGGAAARMLMDMLFEEEQFKGKNCTTMEKEYPEKIRAIKNYVIEKYKLEEPKITKAITNKCGGY